MSMMIESIAKDGDLIIPCSTPLCDQMGYDSCAMGLPVKLGKGGVKEVDHSGSTRRERKN